MSHGTTGSYQARPDAAEADRLRAQAARLWDDERAAMQRLGLGRAARFLDVGCGPGAVLDLVTRDFAPRLAVGVDVDAALLARARAAPLPGGGPTLVLKANGAALPLPDGAFDFVLLRLVLRHTPARDALLAEAARVAAPGGMVCATDVDEQATTLEPEPAAWPALRAALAATARRRGGDPFVGRRLPALLRAAGLDEPAVAMLPLSTAQVAPATFVEVMLAPAVRPVDADLMAPAAVQAAWAEVRAWARDPAAFAYGLGIMAAARRP